MRIALARLTAAALASAALASPATAATELRTRVVGCGADSCLLVSGTRADAGSAVSINGHPVAVEGGRSWRVRVPVGTIRAWSPPLARTIAVGLSDDGTRAETVSLARLPIGLLGHADQLASLVVRVK